jgi:uncharacterized protein (TIGR03435 family)
MTEILASSKIGMTMGDLASGQLTRYVDRFVADQTGLPGPYDWALSWGSASDGISIFTAVQEQLGLKLEPQRGRACQKFCVWGIT